MKKVLYTIAIILILGVLAACRQTPEEPLTYTVTFDTDGGTLVESQEVLNGARVTRPADPVKEGFMFTGKWMSGNFEWNFNVDIVTDDVTLLATWIEISSTPTEIQITDDAFSSVISWMQTDADLQTFIVSIKSQTGSYTVIEGDFEIDTSQVLHVVRFTPETLPQGGYYDVKIDAGAESSEALNLLFGGAGTEANPYVVTEVSDVISILEDASLSDKHFKQLNDILSTLTQQIQINNARKIVFSGSYNGQNYAISFTGNGGLFHEITETGVVKNLVIDSTTNLSAAEANLYPIGAVADKNAGLIENIATRALLENSRLQGGLPVYSGVDTSDLTTGAGGIVGLNLSSGIIRNVTVSGAGAVKAGRGVGGVAAYNFGMIEYVNVTATLPAGNQANSGNSSNTYSYGGGIAGFNFGTIQYAAVTGRVFAQSAYAEAGNGNEGKNIAFGGIAGYNEGIIRNSSFARSLAAKEFIDKSRAGELGDAANNLGVASVHGDLYVGGIAGINAGQITNVYVGGALIGARDFAGGIAGLTLGSGTITQSYVFAEVAIKDTAGAKLTAGEAKTTATTYEIAPSGFDANSVFFKPLVNSVTNQTWVPGQLEAPKLPEFTAADLEKVGNLFAASGVLLWQQGNVTGVDIALETVALPFGTTLQLQFNVNPASAPDLYTTWTSSDPDVVRVVGEGLIEGVGEGTATITVTTRDGGFTDTVLVTVEDYVKVSTVNVSSPEFTLPAPNDSADRPEIEINTVINFVVELLPEDARFKNYTLTSSNSRAVVDGNQVTFVFGATSLGNVSIRISFEDSSLPELEYRFKTIETLEPVETPITSVTITSPDITLPTPNDADIRDDIEIGSVVNVVVSDILPENASNKNYTVTVSNSRGTVVGNEVTFITLGFISIYVDFEDTSIGDNGRFNFRFTIIEGAPADVPITSATITSPEIILPEANNSAIRDDIEIGSVINLVVDILPVDASNKNYTITVSNSRGTVVGNEITFITLGLISIYIDFQDTSIGDNGRFNFRFTIVEAPVETVTITSPDITLPEANNSEVRDDIVIDSVINLVVDILPDILTSQNYTVSVSNSRGTVVGNEVTFITLGLISIYVDFEDTSIGDNGRFNFRFTIVDVPADVPITSVTITSPEITLPEANNADIRPEIEIGTIITIDVDILPIDASNKNFTITTSNSRATVDGNEVTFVFGNTGPGSVSVRVLFEDTSVGVNGLYEFRFSTIEGEPVEVPITSVTITSPEITLPEANNADIRPEIEIGTIITIDVDILPIDASNKNFTITTSNSRATVDGNEVTFVYGNTGPGSVSVRVLFEDTSVGVNGLYEFRFSTIEGEPVEVPITSVTITSPEITLPEANNADIRPQIEIGTVITIDVDILPIDATNQNYTITTSNSRATVDGNQVTFVYGNTGPGSVSVRVLFEDTSVGVNGLYEFRFSTFEPILISSATITSPEITLPEANNADIRDVITIGTVITVVVDILPVDATNQNYTITTSNSRATVDGNEVTFVFGNTGPGSVSILVTFEDTSIGNNGVFNFRFTTQE